MTRGLRSIQRQGAKEEASNHHEATSPSQIQQPLLVPVQPAPVQPVPQVSAAAIIQPTLMAQRQTNVVT